MLAEKKRFHHRSFLGGGGLEDSLLVGVPEPQKYPKPIMTAIKAHYFTYFWGLALNALSSVFRQAVYFESQVETCGVDGVYGGSHHNIPNAIFHLLKGDYTTIL